MTQAQQRTAVVTGASSGIGEATARLLAERGWRVVGVARRADRLAALADGTGIETIAADLTTDEGVALVRDALAAAGPIHALVNNAGGALGMASIEESDVEDWRTMFETNVIAVKQLLTALLPLLRQGARETGVADVLTVTSIAGHIPYEGGAGYNAAKFAEHALMAVLRMELGGEPIRVVEVAPGMVRTDFSLVRFKGDRERADAVYEGVPDPLVAADVAAQIVHALELPAHVNLDLVTIKPVAQIGPGRVVKRPLAVRE